MRDLDRTNPRYRPLLPIGRGGMAEVLLGLMNAGPGLSKLVVLKRIWPDLATDPDFVAMFRDEARLAILLSHPNVVHTHEVIEDGQQLAIAMEYLHGQPLTALLNRLGGPGELSLSLRLRIVVEVLAGLHYAHELKGFDGTPLEVVHRDVSPHNVFITYDGHVKLMDFGVAKTAAALHRTRPGAIKGRVSYMAPEHLRSDKVDRRADVFAAGVMLWELLAGRRLWQGMPEAQIVHHLASRMPIPELPVDLSRPVVLDAICARALAMDPDRRYPTAAELQIDLEEVLAGAADSHARTLGRIVSHAFGAARTEWEALIARALEKDREEAPAPVPAAPASHAWAKALDALIPDRPERTTAHEAPLEQTVVDAEIVYERPVRSPGRRWLRIAAVAGMGAAAGAGLFATAAPRVALGRKPVAVVAEPSTDDPTSSLAEPEELASVARNTGEVEALGPDRPWFPSASGPLPLDLDLYNLRLAAGRPSSSRSDLVERLPAARVRRADPGRRVGPAEGKSPRAQRRAADDETGSFDQLSADGFPRPASLRTIDEGDPFR